MAADTASDERPEIDLKNVWVALILAWLIPGAGHLYQRRYFKGVLFTVCILGIFLVGIFLGGSQQRGWGRVVYVVWQQDESFPSIFQRPSYICQFFAGGIALPALIQAKAVEAKQSAPLGTFMKPPSPGNSSELDDLNKELGRYWELGTVYTMIAGLLNILAIWDACCGPKDESSDDSESESEEGN